MHYKTCMMKHILKLAVALIATLVFFAIWDRADITDYRVVSYNSSGLSYDAKGDYDRAVDAFSKAIRLYSGSATLFNNRGNAFRGKGDFDHAIAEEAVVTDQDLVPGFDKIDEGRLHPCRPGA